MLPFYRRRTTLCDPADTNRSSELGVCLVFENRKNEVTLRRFVGVSFIEQKLREGFGSVIALTYFLRNTETSYTVRKSPSFELGQKKGCQN
jgi:hypothetical protein